MVTAVSVSVAFAGLAVAADLSSVLAQQTPAPSASIIAGASPAPSAPVPSAAVPSAAALDAEDLVPDQLGGLPTEVTITRGSEHLDGLDASDPADADTLAELAALLAATGRPVEDLTTALAFVSADDLFAFVVAFRIAGAPDDTILPVYLPLLLDDLTVTRQESRVLADREVLVVYSDEGDGEVPVYILSHGDTVWLLQGPEDVVAGALESLPA